METPETLEISSLRHSMSKLADRLLALHEALVVADLPHAFGGAIALAYCTKEPRGTRDLDINVFVDVQRSGEVLDCLPSDVTVTQSNRSGLRKKGQVRVMWDDTPIDLFLDTHEFHRQAREEVREVPFEAEQIPVLGCASLVVFKAMFNRTRDWADIEAIIEVGKGDPRRALHHLDRILGGDDPIVGRLGGLLS